MILRDSLLDPRLADELNLLALREEDRDTVVHWVREVAAHGDDLARVEVLLDRLRARVGDPASREVVFELCDTEHRLGRGVLPLLALVLTAPAVREEHARRDVPSQVSDASLADLGQQVWKDRQVNGSTGLHNQVWLTRVWSGQLLKLGRLQFELTRSPVGMLESPVPVLDIHIDESGPLYPQEVDDSLRQASTFFEDHFPEVGPIDWFTCRSWLLDPGLAWRMPDSNLADFARRFTLWEVEEKDRDALYFGFGMEPAVGAGRPDDLAALPADTSLRRAVIELWRDGEPAMLCSGRIPVISGLI